MQRTVIGIDLGGTKIDAARYDARSWKVLERSRIPTEASKGFPHVLDTLIQLTHDLKDKTTRAVGIGVPGFVQQPAGIILRLPNIPKAENARLKDIVRKRSGLPTFIENDAHCFALAEAIDGAGKGQEVVIGITMGTGVGGGIVINGKIFGGTHGFAGEMGHMLLVPGQPPYATKDTRGDIEQFFSGTALGKRCPDAQTPDDYLSNPRFATLQTAVIQEISWMCANLTHMLDPGVIVFGGSAGKALKPHLPSIRKTLQEWVLPDTPLPKLTLAKLSDGAIRGAALLCGMEYEVWSI